MAPILCLFAAGCAVVTVLPPQVTVGAVIGEPQQDGFSASRSLYPWREFTVELPNRTAKAVIAQAGAGAYFRLSDCAGKEVWLGKMYAGLEHAWSENAKAASDGGNPVAFTGLVPSATFDSFSAICGEVTTAGYELRHLKAKFRLK